LFGENIKQRKKPNIRTFRSLDIRFFSLIDEESKTLFELLMSK